MLNFVQFRHREMMLSALLLLTVTLVKVRCQLIFQDGSVTTTSPFNTLPAIINSGIFFECM